MRLAPRFRQIAKQMPFADVAKHLLAVIKRRIHRRRIQEYASKAQGPNGRPRVLVLMNGGIGNAVEATPLLQALRMLWPKAQITAYVPEGDLLDDWCVVDELACYPESLEGRTFDHTFMTWSVDPPLQHGDIPPDLGKVHEFPLVGARFLKPEREYNLDLARSIGYRGPCPPLYASLLRPTGPIPGGPLRIALVPAAKPGKLWRYKCWPYYGELAHALLEQHADTQIYILGGNDDAADLVFPIDPRVSDFRGRHSLRETAWMFRHSDLAIGNDSGPMHIADAVQTPALVLFGPTCELKNGPRNKAVPLTAGVDCRPCQYEFGMLTCEDPRCMTELKPQLVVRRVNDMLSRPSTP